MGRVNNLNFVQLPFSTLIEQIRYRAEETGINVIMQEESHTGMCSLLDRDSMEHHDTYHIHNQEDQKRRVQIGKRNPHAR
jgi:putative transposase